MISPLLSNRKGAFAPFLCARELTVTKPPLFYALSIVEPSGLRIAEGVKTLEIRSWQPEHLPLKNLVIVENQNFLHYEGDEEDGYAVAIVDVESVHVWQEHEVKDACASQWAEGYFAWVLTNVRTINPCILTTAKRKLYTIELSRLDKL